MLYSKKVRGRKVKMSKMRTIMIFIILVFALYIIGFTLSTLDAEPEQMALPDLGGRTLYSKNALLMRLEDGTVLFEKNSRERIYPASMTKMMTVLVTLEQFEDMDTTVRLPERVFLALDGKDASLAGFLPGEQLTLRDLLYGCMLPSGADAALGLAAATAGSEENFTVLMNEKARELGMKQTHFENATGLQDKGHYSSVADMTLLLREALKNKDFQEIFTTRYYQTGSTNRHPDGVSLSSTMNVLPESESPDGFLLLGGKTGYTEEAGLCLATLAEKGGKEYIAVTAGAPGGHETEPCHLLDAFSLYDAIILPE